MTLRVDTVARDRPGPAKQAILVGPAGVGARVALVRRMSRLAGTGDATVLADDTFEAGDPTEMSRVIARDRPILYADAPSE